MTSINVYGKSVAGRRANNEDSYLILRPANDVCFIAIADGMGGTSGGAYASNLVLDHAGNFINNLYHENRLSDLKEAISGAFNAAINALHSAIEDNPQYQEMGTTLVCILIVGEKYVWGNIGDSRLYIYSSNNIQQITKDHSYIQEYIDENGPNVPQNIIRSYGHILVKSISSEKVEPEIFPKNKPYEVLLKNSGFLLCSDGLILEKASQNHKQLLSVVLAGNKLEDSVERLIRYALENESNDNITVILLEQGKITRPRKGISLKSEDRIRKKDRSSSDSKKKIRITLKVLYFTIGFICLSLFYFLNKTNEDTDVVESYCETEK